jgi:multidrug efflux pump
LSGWRPIVFFIGTFVLLIFSFMLMGIFPPKVLFFPENEPKYVNVFIEYPIGTDISKTNALSEKLELKVLDVIKPYNPIVESVITKVGEDTADPQDPSAFGQSSTPNKARITVNFKDYRFRVIDGKFINTIHILNQIREEIGEYPGVTVTVDKDANGPPVGKPITIEVVGPDFEPLIDITERMRQYILASGIEGIEKLKTDLETGKPELLIHIDRDNARRFGLSTGQIATEIRTALYGKEVSKYKVGEDDYEIQIRLKDDYRYNLDALMNKSITFRNQSTGKIHQVPISAVAKAEFTTTYGSVRRKDMDRIVTLSSNVLGGYNATEVNQQIEALLESFDMPYGYSFRFGGEQKEQEEEMSFLGGALMLAVMIIFLIIVAQFNKITTPLIIMSSVLLSTAGVFIGMIVFNMEFIVIMTMLGIISLAGIVVNNAIVLIDFIELKRKRMALEQGVDKLSIPDVIVAIREAGKTRLRPVLLTAITTILGLIPLAVGINIDFIKFYTEYDAGFYLGGDNVIFWSPMSWTIIHGLTFATFLTLVIVPIMYLFFARINRKLGVS